jgi:hypothetical protein
VCVTLFLVVLHFLDAKNACRVYFFQDETKECTLNINIFCKKNSMRGVNDYVRYIPFYSCVFLSIIFSLFLEKNPFGILFRTFERHFFYFFSS